MTRQLNEVERFEHGTLLQVSPHPDYADVGSSHVYYVPDRARQDAGMEQVQQRESTEEFCDEDGSFDWEAITDLVSPADLVERVEETTLNRTDGAVGNTSRAKIARHSWRQSSSDRPTIPAGVVKFGDPEAEREDAPLRDPIKRGYCWAAVQERVLADSVDKRVEYRDDVQHAHVLRARVPMSVVRSGDNAVAGYLAAHDHHDRYIAHALDTDPEKIPDLLEESRAA